MGKGTVSIEGGFPGLRHSLCFSELIREDIVSSFMTQAARGTESMEEGRGKEQRETRGRGGVSEQKQGHSGAGGWSRRGQSSERPLGHGIITGHSPGKDCRLPSLPI